MNFNPGPVLNWDHLLKSFPIKVMCIDPGPIHSGVAELTFWSNGNIQGKLSDLPLYHNANSGKLDGKGKKKPTLWVVKNELLLDIIGYPIIIERVRSYGRPVKTEMFEMSQMVGYLQRHFGVNGGVECITCPEWNDAIEHVAREPISSESEIAGFIKEHVELLPISLGGKDVRPTKHNMSAIAAGLGAYYRHIYHIEKKYLYQSLPKRRKNA